MGRIFGIVLLLIALYFVLNLHAENLDAVLGRVSAPIESPERGDAPLATRLSPAAHMADPPAERRRAGAPVTDRVRRQVSSDIQAGAERRGY